MIVVNRASSFRIFKNKKMPLMDLSMSKLRVIRAAEITGFIGKKWVILI
jgi:hypothetical protein